MFKALKKYLGIDFNPYHASFFDFLKFEFFLLATKHEADLIGLLYYNLSEYYCYDKTAIGLIDVLFIIPAFVKWAFYIVCNQRPTGLYSLWYAALWCCTLLLLTPCYFIASVLTTLVSAVITLISSPFVFLMQQYYHRQGNRLRQNVSKIKVVSVNEEDMINLRFGDNHSVFEHIVIEKSKLLSFLTSKKNEFLNFKDYVTNSLEKNFYVTEIRYGDHRQCILKSITLKNNNNYQFILGIFRYDGENTYHLPSFLVLIGKNEFSALKSLLKLMRIEYKHKNCWLTKDPIFNDRLVQQLYCAKFEAELLYPFLPEINPIQELRMIPIVAQFAVAERAKKAARGSALVQLENAIQPLLPIINNMAGLPAMSDKDTNQLTSFRNRYVKTYFARSLQTEQEVVNQGTLTYSS